MAQKQRLRALVRHHRPAAGIVRNLCSAIGTLTATQLAAAASYVARARTGSRRSPIGHCPPTVPKLDARTAYDVQDALHEILVREPEQGQIVGTKIGCTTAVMQEFLGMTHPCSGAIFESTLRHDDGTFTCAGADKAVRRRGVECEIAVRLGENIVPHVDGSPHTRASIERAVSECMAAIEVVDDRYVDFEARVPGWETWVADDFFGAGCVLASPAESWRDLDLAAVEGEMKINGESVGRGLGADIINGHPLEALVWLANHKASRGQTLQAGQIVMLGSVVQTNWVQSGDVVEVTVAGLGSATARFV